MFRVMMALLLSGCSVLGNLPDPTLPEAPAPSPTPTPCPTPPPPPEPAAGLFNAPDVVPVAAPFAVTLCKPFVPNTVLHIDAHLLGTFGQHRPTGCMIVTVPGLNTAGKRQLRVGDLTRPILVFDAKSFPKK